MIGLKKTSISLAVLVSTLGFPALAQENTKTYSVLGVSHYEPTELLTFATLLTQQQFGAVTPKGLAQNIETIYLEDGYLLAAFLPFFDVINSCLR